MESRQNLCYDSGSEITVFDAVIQKKSKLFGRVYRHSIPENKFMKVYFAKHNFGGQADRGFWRDNVWTGFV